MNTLTDQLEQLAELQQKNLEPVRHLNDAALSAFERIARKNYELMGDMVEYAVAQSRGQLEPGSVQERYARQLAEAQAFAERLGTRAAEYAELAGTMREGMTRADDAPSEVAETRSAPDASPGGTTDGERVRATAGRTKKKPAAKRAAARSGASGAAAGKAGGGRKRAAAGTAKKAGASGKKSGAGRTAKKAGAARTGRSKKRAASRKSGG